MKKTLIQLAAIAALLITAAPALAADVTYTVSIPMTDDTNVITYLDVYIDDEWDTCELALDEVTGEMFLKTNSAISSTAQLVYSESWPGGDWLVDGSTHQFTIAESADPVVYLITRWHCCETNAEGSYFLEGLRGACLPADPEDCEETVHVPVLRELGCGTGPGYLYDALSGGNGPVVFLQVSEDGTGVDISQTPDFSNPSGTYPLDCGGTNQLEQIAWEEVCLDDVRRVGSDSTDLDEFLNLARASNETWSQAHPEIYLSPQDYDRLTDDYNADTRDRWVPDIEQLLQP